jgi:hypothetical protein
LIVADESARPPGPGRLLTRHFFNAFFDLGFLTDEGTLSLERALLGSSAVALGIGLLLVRIFIGKYAVLAGGPLEAYRQAVAADHAFLMALPMWVVASAVVAVGHALFPDETDFRVLMAEPVSRATIFGAKLSALLLFVGLFAVGSHAALAPLSLLTMAGPAGGGPVVARMAAFAVSTTIASLCAALSAIALHGLLVLLVPRSHQLTAAAAVRSGLVWLLVLSLLFIARLPGMARAFASDAWWLWWTPPAWFVGLERWLLGDGTMRSLAFEAVAVTAAAGLVAVGAYAILYRRFDRTMLTPAASPDAWARRNRGAPSARRWSVRRAIGTFTSITLQRSMLHQGIVVAFGAAAAGLVVNGLIVSGLPRRGGGNWILLWAPFALMFIASPAVRLSLSVPLELRANWIFRTTEHADTRSDVIAAAVRTVFALGVLLPMAVLLPLQWLAFGSSTAALAGVELAVGWLLVEILMRGWRRIPFTCSYVPGKGFVPHMFVRGVVAFLVFTNVGARLLQLCTEVPSALPLVLALICVPAVFLFVRRRRQRFPLGLAFEDELPSEINPLRLEW